MDKVFNKIYNSNFWGGDHSRSGRGSDKDQTRKIVEKLPEFFKKYSIKTIVDASCGDFNWMNEVLSKSEFDSYKGIDIVPELIADNNKKYKSEKISFESGDISVMTFPQVDLIFCRDALVHMPLEAVYRTIKNFKESGAKYLLITNFVKTENNKEIKAGDWRPLNFERAPFKFIKPIDFIMEETTVDNNLYFEDKTLSLWDLTNIVLPDRESFLLNCLQILTDQYYSSKE